MRSFYLQKLFAVFVYGILAASCSAQPKTSAGEIFETQDKTKFTLETVAAGLEVPWAIRWLPNGDMLVTERPGRVRLITGGKLREEPVFTVPDVEPRGESGLMDVSIHPAFKTSPFVYLCYAYRPDEEQRVRVMRYKYVDGRFSEPKTIIENIPAAPNHAGCRARFGPDGKLYITAGDATDWNLAQDKMSLAGKTLRLNDDGSVPADNPFVKDKAYRPEIWSLGHRNAQGLTWQPSTGLMFQTEHGPSQFEGRGGGADEVNIVEAGKNYGWPEIYGTRTKEGMISPLIEYSPACAPASAAFFTGEHPAQFRNNLFVGCLAGRRLIRIKLDGRRVVGQEDILSGKLGRIREVASGPDGYLYFTTSNRDRRGTPAADDDRIFRIKPASADVGRRPEQ